MAETKPRVQRNFIEVARALMSVIPNSFQKKEDLCLEMAVPIHLSYYTAPEVMDRRFKMAIAILEDYLKDLPEDCQWKCLVWDLVEAKIDHKSYIPKEDYVDPFDNQSNE